MKLLVTAPLTLEPQVVVDQIKKISPSIGHLIMTEEFARVYGSTISPLVPDKCLKNFPLDSSDFGESAIPVRQIEMIQEAEALLVIRSTIEPEKEPHVHINSLITLAHKYDLLVQEVET